MKSSYRRIAMQILDRYRDYPNARFWTDHSENTGWCVRSEFDSDRVKDVPGVAFHAASEEEADAVVEAIENARLNGDTPNPVYELFKKRGRER